MTKPIASNTKAQHTPGPWKVIDRRQYDGSRKDGNLTPWIVYADGPISEPICRVIQEFIGERAGSTDEERALQNARLIAAAPALLEALRELVNDLNEDSRFDVVAHSQCWDQARVALALVEGRDA